MIPDRIDATIEAIADTTRSIRDEAAALSEHLGRLTEAVRRLRERLETAITENDELRARLSGRTIDD